VTPLVIVHYCTTTPDLFLPASGERASYGAMVERRDGPSWLRDDADDDDDEDDHEGSLVIRATNLKCEWPYCMYI